MRCRNAKASAAALTCSMPVSWTASCLFPALVDSPEGRGARQTPAPGPPLAPNPSRTLAPGDTAAAAVPVGCCVCTVQVICSAALSTLISVINESGRDRHASLQGSSGSRSPTLKGAISRGYWLLQPLQLDYKTLEPPANTRSGITGSMRWPPPLRSARHLAARHCPTNTAFPTP